MATSNFYENGNHGLNVIHTDYDEAVGDTLANIVAELSSKGYSVADNEHYHNTPRSFATGLNYTVYTPKGKAVAFLEVCAGYYEAANINIYTGDELEYVLDDGYDYDMTRSKRDIDRVVKCVKMYTDGYRRVATFSNGESVYERT